MDNNKNHLIDILVLIDNLQKNTEVCNNDNSCTRPTLVPNNLQSYNTRPFSCYLCNGEPLTINTTEGVEITTFRVEKINNNVVTVRLLNNQDGTITDTSEFASINMNCIAAIRCFNDISLIL